MTMIAFRKRVSGAFTGGAIFCFFASVSPDAAEPNNTGAEDASLELLRRLERVESMLTAQEKKVDRLYRVFEPHLAEMEEEARQKQRQDEEDRELALERVWESSGSGFTDRAACSPADPSFAAVAQDGSIRICDLSGEVLQELRHGEERATTAAYAPDGVRLLAGTAGGQLLLWDLKAGKVREIGERPYEIDRVAWLGQTGRALVCSAREEKIKGPEPGELCNMQGDVFDLENGKAACRFTGWQHLDYQNLMPAPNGKWVALFRIVRDRGVFLLDAQSGKITGRLLTDAGQGLSVAVSPDSSMVAVGNPGIYLWDVKERRILRHLEGHRNWVVSLAFSPDGKRLISGAGDSTARVWDVNSGNELGRIRFPGNSTYVQSVSFSYDGSLVLAAAGRLVIARAPSPPGNP